MHNHIYLKHLTVSVLQNDKCLRKMYLDHFILHPPVLNTLFPLFLDLVFLPPLLSLLFISFSPYSSSLPLLFSFLFLPILFSLSPLPSPPSFRLLFTSFCPSVVCCCCCGLVDFSVRAYLLLILPLNEQTVTWKRSTEQPISWKSCPLREKCVYSMLVLTPHRNNCSTTFAD